MSRIGLHLKQKTEWRAVPEILSFEIALSVQMIIDPKISIVVSVSAAQLGSASAWLLLKLSIDGLAQS